MLNVIALPMLIATAPLLAWSGIRAWQRKNRLLKWGGASLAGLLAGTVSLVSIIVIAGLFKLHARSALLQAPSRRCPRSHSCASRPKRASRTSRSCADRAR
jgi:hypothetical protein